LLAELEPGVQAKIEKIVAADLTKLERTEILWTSDRFLIAGCLSEAAGAERCPRIGEEGGRKAFLTFLPVILTVHNLRLARACETVG
jgi:hypothetical protein